MADYNHSPVDITALEDSEVIFISKGAVMNQMMACPSFLKVFMAFNANRIKYLSDRLKLFAQKGIKAKIAYYILSKAKDNKFDTGRSITSLAEYFGVERPSLSRALSEMTRDGVISYHAGKGTVLDYNELHMLLD